MVPLLALHGRLARSGLGSPGPQGATVDATLAGPTSIRRTPCGLGRGRRRARQQQASAATVSQNAALWAAPGHRTPRARQATGLGHIEPVNPVGSPVQSKLWLGVVGWRAASPWGRYRRPVALRCPGSQVGRLSFRPGGPRRLSSGRFRCWPSTASSQGQRRALAGRKAQRRWPRSRVRPPPGEHRVDGSGVVRDHVSGRLLRQRSARTPAPLAVQVDHSFRHLLGIRRCGRPHQGQWASTGRRTSGSQRCEVA